MQNTIFLYDVRKRDKDARMKLAQIVNIYDYSMDDIQRNIDNIIDYLSKYIGDGTCSIYVIGQYIKFRMVKKGPVQELPLIEFLCNIIMMAPMIDMDVELDTRHLFNPVKLTDAEIRRYINSMIYEYKDRVTFFRMCEYIQFIKKNFNKICIRIGEKIGNSISLNQFISLMEDDKEIEEILTCTFPIPKDITPNELENLVNQKATKLMNHIMTRTDLDISTYVKNNLFNKGQFKEFAVHITHKPNLLGSTIPATSNTNILKGIKDHIAGYVDSAGGRKAEVLKLNVSDAGDFERTLCSLLADIRYVDNDYEICDSVHFRKKFIESHDSLEAVEGRVYALEPDAKVFNVIDPKRDMELIGKTIYMKTPITCTHPKRHEGYLCKSCYGHLLAAINTDIHIGRLSALSSADEIQQVLLSAKHALETKSEEIIFNENFFDFFRLENVKIFLLEEFRQTVIDDDSSVNLFFEFNINNVVKHKDGEGRRYDRAVTEIVIYNQDTDERVIIEEKGGTEIFMSPEVSEIYTERMRNSVDEVILIPITDFLELDPEVELFEVNYKNSELAEPLFVLTSTLNKGEEVEKFQSYDEFLDTIIPLFKKGGIRIPDIHIEMIVNNLTFSHEGKKIDWSDEEVEYKFFTLTKSILLNGSPIISLMYKNMSEQLRGSHYTYEKSGPSIYDVYIDESSDK